MTSRRTLRLLCGLAFSLVPAAPAAAQALALSDASVPPAAALAGAYHLRLESVWPQAGADADCRNGGGETIEGTLVRGADGVYRGSLARRTLLLFCGAHAGDGEVCELVLEGDGEVAMTGRVVPDAASPSGRALHVSWQPSPTHGATARGTCSADFKRSIEAMYLTVAHGAEFAVPAAGSEARREKLENYAWTVTVAGR